MKQFVVYTQTIISVLAIILSIIAVCSHYPRSVNLGIDYLGIIVGVLGVLVAILIGWQLYNSLNLKELVEHTEKAKKDAIDARNQAQQLLDDVTKLSNDLQDIVKNVSISNQKNTDDIVRIAKRIQQLHESINKASNKLEVLYQIYESLRGELQEKISKSEVKKASDNDMKNMFLRVLEIDDVTWAKIKNLVR